MTFFDKVLGYINPSLNPNIEPATKHLFIYLPTLWLLGKTGSGKSSLIQTITGDSRIKIGDGFRPCTMTSNRYDFPKDKPLFRFLDTRGLGESSYNSDADIKICKESTSALVVVMKAEEPEQSSVLKALAMIRKTGALKQILLVHTAVQLVNNESERAQCIAHNQSQVESVWKKKVTSVSVDFNQGDGQSIGVTELKLKLVELLPILSLIEIQEAHSSNEEANFSKLRNEILWYASATGCTDAVPVVGLVSVPMIQAKMLHSLANQYGVVWDKRAIAEFIAMLGSGFTAQYVSKLGLRQLIKLIPAYGQTVGSATAAVFSFGTTYAIGRVACKYMYHKSKGEPISEDELKSMYKSAFSDINNVGGGDAYSQ